MEIKRFSASEQIFDDVVQKIRTRVIRPGQRLVIKALEQEYKVSSTPVRDALFLLKSCGFVELRSAGTATVITMSDQDKADIVELNEELTDMAFRLIMRNGTIAQIREQMRPLYQRQLELKDAPAQERLRAFADFINVPGAATGNTYYAEMTMAMYGKSVVAFGDYTEAIDPDEALENSRQMMEALNSGDWEQFQKLRYFIIDCFRRYLKQDGESGGCRE